MNFAFPTMSFLKGGLNWITPFQKLIDLIHRIWSNLLGSPRFMAISEEDGMKRSR